MNVHVPCSQGAEELTDMGRARDPPSTPHGECVTFDVVVTYIVFCGFKGRHQQTQAHFHLQKGLEVLGARQLLMSSHSVQEDFQFLAPLLLQSNKVVQAHDDVEGVRGCKWLIGPTIPIATRILRKQASSQSITGILRCEKRSLRPKNIKITTPVIPPHTFVAPMWTNTLQ